MTNEHAHQRPVAFLTYRVNGQNIMKRLASTFLLINGRLGFIILDQSNAPNIQKLNRLLLLFIGFAPAEFLHGWSIPGNEIVWLPDRLMLFKKKSVDPRLGPGNGI